MQGRGTGKKDNGKANIKKKKKKEGNVREANWNQIGQICKNPPKN